MSNPDSSLPLGLGRLFGRTWLAWLTLLLSASLFLGLWAITSTDDGERSAARFKLRGEVMRDLLADRMRDYEQMLQGAAALFQASDDVSRQEWHDYVRGLAADERMPGVLGTGFVLMLRPEERAAHEAAVRAQGFPGYAIRPPGERPLLSTILYIEPFTGDNLRAFGYDMFSEPVRQAAMQRACDSGRPALSGRVTLVQEGTGKAQPGFLIYNPVFRKSLPLTTVDERRAALFGFTYSPFRAQAVLARIFATSNLDVEVEVFDGPPEPGNLLFASDQAARQARHTMLLETVIAGYPWTLRIRSSEAFEVATRNNGPTLILLGGMVFSLLLFAMLYLLARHSRQMEAAAAELARRRDELRAAASYSRSLLEASLDPLVTISADGKISDVNAATEEVTGRRRDELLGTDFSDYFTDPEQARRGYRQVFENGEVKDYPLTIRHAAGRLTEVLYNASIYRNERGEIAGIFAAARDVTQANAVAAELERHRQHLEDMVLQRTRELAAAKDAAESANRAKGTILANLSHELRTPLNHIIGAGTLLKREVTSDKGREWLEMMGTSAHGLLRLLTNLLETVKLEAGQLTLDEGDFELSWVVNKLERESRTAVAAKGLAFVSELAPDMPVRVHGDMRLLEQVLGELVDNAVKFSESGTIALRVSRVPESRQSECLRFEVDDQGIGMGDEFRDRAFQLFNQGDGSATRKYGGTGLGLARCKRIVSLMAGEIGFYARPGGGSTFWVELPLAAAGAPAAPADAGLNAAAVRGKLAALREALAAGSFDAQALWSELAPALAPALGERLPVVEEAIAGFDFEVAAGILAELPD